MAELKKQVEGLYKIDKQEDKTKAILGYKGKKADEFLKLTKDWIAERDQALLKALQAKLEKDDAAKAPGDLLDLEADRPHLKADLAAEVAKARKKALDCLETAIKELAEGVREKVTEGLGTDPSMPDFKKATGVFEKQAANPLGTLADEDLRSACLDTRKEELLVFAFDRIASSDGEVQVAEALKSVATEQAKQKQALEAVLEDGDPNGDPKRRVICDWPTDPTSMQLNCHPKGLLVAGDFVAQVIVRGLPPGEKARIEAATGEVFLADNIDPKALGCSSAADCLSRCTGCQPGSTLSPAAPSGSSPPEALRVDLARDCLAGLDTSESPQRIISVFVDRVIYPKHRGYYTGNPLKLRSKAVAAELLRQVNRQNLSVISRGDTTALAVSVQVGDEVKTARIPLIYRRWSFEAGGFFAVASKVDQELTTETEADGKVKVTAIRNADNWRQESGAFLTFFPDNYPMVGVGLGFSTPSGRSASIFLGPTIRLLGLGNQAVLTLSGGVSISQQRHFPDVVVSKDGQDPVTYSPDSAALKGNLKTELGGYCLLSLGFQFGPVPGPKANS
ncbi:MAG TPA: hypothetical protein PK413_01360 [Thermoanaerobaculia bacterium]|nr:hypothetical protein [Thermoanaerobaculia bacterium]